MSGRYQELNAVCDDSTSDKIESVWGSIYTGVDREFDTEIWILKFKYEGAELRKRIKFIAQFRTNDSLVSIVDTDWDANSVITDCQGESLRSFLARRGAISQTVVRRFLAQFLELFAKFEEKNFIHGDVRSDMFFLPPDWNEPDKIQSLPLKLFPSLGPDWNSTLLGPAFNPKYCAPEICNQQWGQPTPLSDLFSLGFLALEMLIGPEFNSKFSHDLIIGEPDWAEIHGSVSAGEFPPVSELCPKIAPDLRDTLDLLLKRKPSDRCQSAREALSKLDLTIGDEDAAEEEEDEEENRDVVVRTIVRSSMTGALDEDYSWEGLETTPKSSAKPQKNLYERVKGLLGKSYVVFPLIAVAIEIIMAATVSRLGETLEFVSIKFPSTTLKFPAEPQLSADFARYVEIFDMEGKKYAKRWNSQEGAYQWRLPEKSREYQAKAPNHETAAFKYNRKDGLSVQDKKVEKIELKPQELKVVVEKGELDEKTFESLDVEVYRNGTLPVDPSSRSLESWTSRWDGGNYRIGVYCPGYKPKSLVEVHADDREISIRAPSVPCNLSDDDEKLAKDIYRLLCAVPLEWKSREKTLGQDGRFQKLVDSYMAALESAPQSGEKLERSPMSAKTIALLGWNNWERTLEIDARYKELIGGYMKTRRLVDESVEKSKSKQEAESEVERVPITKTLADIREQTLNYFNETALAVFNAQPVYLENDPEGPLSSACAALSTVKEIVPEWKDGEFWTRCIAAQREIENVFATCDVTQIAKDRNKFSDAYKDVYGYDLSKLTNPEHRQLLVRLLGRYALVMRSLAEIKKDSGYAKDFVKNSLEAALEILGLQETFGDDEYSRALQKYLVACVKLQLWENDAGAYPLDGASKLETDFHESYAFFNKVDRTRAAAAYLHYCETRRKRIQEGEGQSEGISLQPIEPIVNDGGLSHAALLYLRFLSFYYCQKDSLRLMPAAQSFAEQASLNWSVKVDTGESAPQDASFDAETLANLYFQKVDGEFFPTQAELVSRFNELQKNLDSESRKKFVEWLKSYASAKEADGASETKRNWARFIAFFTNLNAGQGAPPFRLESHFATAITTAVKD